VVQWYELSHWAALAPKNRENIFERYGQKRILNYKGVVLWAANVCSWAAFAQLEPVSSISLGSS